MGEEFSKQSRGCAIWICGIAALLLFVGYLLFRSLPSPIEIVSRLTSPDGKWTISDQYDSRSSNFQIILRDSSGKEIAKGTERHVDGYLIDLLSDWNADLEITNDTAGAREPTIVFPARGDRIVVAKDGLGGYPKWRLNVEDSKWHLVSASETPVKSDDESSREK